MKQTVYLDHAAATPLDDRVLGAMQPYFSHDFYNPSAGYQPAREVRTRVDQARAAVAHVLGARGPEIIFTSGGTEANNLAIAGVMEQYSGANMLVSAIEHESVLEPAARYACQVAPVDTQGIIKLDTIQEQIDDQTVLVSVMQANNEIGTVQPLRKVARIIQAIKTDRRRRNIRRPLYFHTDATQAANYLDLHVHRLGIDMMTLNGGKIYGPKGAGALFVSSGVSLWSQIVGGGQQRNLRSGTENIAGAVGLAAALEATQTLRAREARRLTALQNQMIEQLEVLIPGVIINGSRKYRLPNNVHITIPDQDNERLLMTLDAAGIYAAAGSACSAHAEAASHVLRAIGCSETAARASLRFTLGRATSRADITHTTKLLAGVLTSDH